MPIVVVKEWSMLLMGGGGNGIRVSAYCIYIQYTLPLHGVGLACVYCAHLWHGRIARPCGSPWDKRPCFNPRFPFNAEGACTAGSLLLSTLSPAQEDMVELTGARWPLPCEPKV